MNIYSGVAIFDENGETVVELPEWFEALNGDFRYQLTCIESFSPVYIAEKVRNNRFKIAGGKCGSEVSWQVVGVRTDPWAREHPLVLVKNKTAIPAHRVTPQPRFPETAPRATGDEVPALSEIISSLITVPK